MCFSLSWIVNLLIWLVATGAIVAVVRLLLPHVLASFGAAGTLVVQVLNVIVWAAVLIVIIIVCFDLLTCLPGFAHRVR